MRAMGKVYFPADFPGSVFSMADFQKFKKGRDSLLGHYGWLAKDAMQVQHHTKTSHACM